MLTEIGPVAMEMRDRGRQLCHGANLTIRRVRLPDLVCIKLLVSIRYGSPILVSIWGFNAASSVGKIDKTWSIRVRVKSRAVGPGLRTIRKSAPCALARRCASAIFPNPAESQNVVNVISMITVLARRANALATSSPTSSALE